MGECRIGPVQRLFPVLAPQRPIGGKTQAAAGDVGAGMFQRERQLAQFPGQRPRLGVVIRRFLALGRAGQQERRGILERQQAEVQRIDSGRKIALPRGHDHVAAGQTRQHRLGLGQCRRGVEVVENEQPAGIGVQPVKHRAQAGFVLPGVEVRQQHAGQGGEVAAQGFGGIADGEQQRGVVVAMRPGVFHRRARLADAAQAQHRLADDRGLPG